MATIYTHRSNNIAKTWLLVGVFLAIVLGIGAFLSYYYDNPGILVIAVIFSVVMNISSFWFSDKIALSMARARPADPGQYRDLHSIVENLAITAGLPKPRVHIIPDQAPNAFATGRNAAHASIAVTEGLLRQLNRSELEGVIAHELAHIGNRDILLQSVVAILVGFIALLADLFTRSMILGAHSDRENKGSNVLMLIGILFIVLSPIVAMLIQLAISRKREYLADATGALLTRYPDGLANALRKIAAYGAPLKHASNATAHMYIANPFGAKARQGFAHLFLTHPPVEKRIKALSDMAL